MAQEHSHDGQSFRQNEARQSFLLKLSDAIRPLFDPIEIQQVAMRILGEQLNVDRVLYSGIDGGDNYTISDNYVRGDFPKIVGLLPVRTFGEVTEWLRKGKMITVDDINADKRLSEATRAAFLQAGVHATIAVPLVKDGHWVANLGVHHGAPRRWTQEEIALVQETAERTWAAVERAKAEEAWRKSESKFRRLSESGIVGIAFFDISGVITEANAEFLRFLGVTRDELQSEKVRWDVYTPEAWMPRTRQAIEELQDTGIIAPYEKQIRHTDGSLRWGLFAGAMLSDGHSGVSTIVDITERKRAEEDLRRSEDRLRLILESAQGFAIFTTDADGVIDSWYASAAQVFGWSEAEILGQKCNVTFTPEDQAAGEPEKERETARREGISPDIRWHQRKDGSRVFINGAMHLLRDGQRNGFFKMGRDETAQRQAEEALRRSEERLRLILESAKGYAIFTSDADGFINSWNPGAAHTFGWSEAEILGQNIDVLFTPEDQASGEPEKELETARTEGIAPDVRWHQRKDGSRVFINGAVHPLRDGQLHGFVKIGSDETKQRQAEEALYESQKQLQFLNETLEQKVEEKTEEVRQLASDVINATQKERQRLSRVLHDDLQQRAYAILMQLSFLRNEFPSENHSAREDASAIEKELAEIVKITRNLSIDLSPPILPGEGLSHAIEWLASRMREQYGLPIELQANGPLVIPNEELHVLLFNCVRELLFNVVKHAGASQAVVALAWVDNGIRIEVRDNGKGLPEYMLEGAASKQDDLPRSLGLPTIRHQLSLFGGVMKIYSEPGGGTQVTMIVPVPKTSQDVSSSADVL